MIANIVVRSILMLFSFSLKVQCLSRVYDYTDMILEARCESKCADENSYPLKHLCLTRCEAETWTKYGFCLESGVNSDLCLATCNVDSQCKETEKCCQSSCGMQCQPVSGLDSITMLPPIPTNITFQEKNKPTNIQIKWDNVQNYSNVFYVVQERHLIGVNYREEKLGQWSNGFVLSENRFSKKINFLPGRWYQIRVASVNLHGSKGFSTPSQPFSLSIAPSAPSAPRNLTFDRVNIIGNKFWVEIHWEPPQTSQLPINKYKVFWSAYMKNSDSDVLTQDNPVITHQAVVSPEQNHYSIPDLDPQKNFYFIRVQAICLFDNQRLKGQFATEFFRPENYPNATVIDIPEVEHRNKKKMSGVKKKINDLRIEKIYTQRNELFAKLTWSSASSDESTDHYTVTWSSNDCNNTKRTVFTASTEVRWYTMHNLNYNCKYKATVKTHHHRILYSASIPFTTPPCPLGEDCSQINTEPNGEDSNEH